MKIHRQIYLRFIKSIRRISLPYRLVFIAMGLASTIWFLFRIIPKPSRASYPCMRAAAPIMSGFILYLLGLSMSVFSFKLAWKKIHNANYFPALLLILAGTILGSFVLLRPHKSALARSTVTEVYHPSNEPMGNGKGIFPGRVVWSWNPEATNADCDGSYNGDGIFDEDDNVYFLRKNNNQEVINQMLSDALKQLSGQGTDSLSWDALFRHFNLSEKNKSDQGYGPGEIIHIKTNATSTWGSPVDASKNQYWGMYSLELDNIETSWAARPDIAETNPHVILALLQQLVDIYGIPQEQIYVGDPMKNIYKHCYELWHDEFPDIKYLGNDLIQDYAGLDLQSLGRTPVEESEGEVIYYSDKGAVMTGAISDKVYKITENADYLINVPTLKAHALAGITISAKNHFGTHTRKSAEHLHQGLTPANGGTGGRNEYGHYRVQVDLMAHEKIGGNTLLVLVDGLYAGPEATSPPDKWDSSPFNGDWTSSLLLSQDQVALESVCFDFLRNEYTGKPCENLNGESILVDYPVKCQAVDDYLHQAADQANWPEGISYDPELDGIPAQSLGTHEHWNDAQKKQYSRNMGLNHGIELLAPGLVNNLPGSNDALTSTHYLHINSNPTILTEDIRTIYSDPDGEELTLEVIPPDPEKIVLTVREDSSLVVQSVNDFSGETGFSILVSDGKDTLVEQIRIRVSGESLMSAGLSPEVDYDGYADENTWKEASWYYIDQLWIPYRSEIAPDDFSGRYKVSWSEKDNLLCFFAETYDDSFVDGYIYQASPGSGGGYPDYDILEIFLDEDRSGGDHVFDGSNSNGENAFSYHMVVFSPEDGSTTSQMVACDLAGTSWGSYFVPDYADHFENFIVRRSGNKLTWEFSLKVYNDTFNPNNQGASEDSRVGLKPGASLGLSLAYCDNDDPDEYPKTRDHFIGSDCGPDQAISEWNTHWQNADVYGIVTLEGAKFNREPQVDSEIPDFSIVQYNTWYTVSDNLFNHFSDADGDTLLFSATTANSHLQIEIVDNAVLTLTANSHFNGVASVTVIASDGQYSASTEFQVSSAVGINHQTELERSVRIYPNPASSQCWFSMTNEMYGEFEFKLLDLNGRVLESHMLYKANRYFEWEFEISAYKPGIYVITIASGTQEINRMLLH